MSRNAEKHDSFRRSDEVSGKLWSEGDAKGWTGPKREGDGQTSPAPSGWGSGAGPAREASETGRLITKSRRWWRKAVSTGTFRMGIRGRAGEGGLWGRAAYNESEKVVEKGRFNRHLPDGDPGQGRRERLLGQGGL